MSGRSGLSWRQRNERGGEKSAEAIVAGVHRAPLALLLADEGPNPLLQGAVGTISMDVERQPGRLYQRVLFEEPVENLRHARGGKGGTQPSPSEESQTFAANEPARALTKFLMEEMTDRENLNQAYRQVKANRGAPGIDGMTISQAAPWIAEHKEELIASLLDGSYQPQPVRGVQIPKPAGGMRQLGIPTVVDRLVQQAILQVLQPLLDPTFSDSSYGFRPGRSAHDALHQAAKYVAEGRTIVVDMDLEKFFDRVNHDILMARLARRIEDKRLLRIIRRFLEAGLMQDGVCVTRHEGTPQGGPLSPLLANLLLDDLDQELQRRGHTFCRYADDCNIYVRSQAAGERVLASITKFLESKLRLRVNHEKSEVAPVQERKFLGHRLLADGRLVIAPQSIQRVKERIRKLTRRNRGVSFERVIGELNSFTTGWVAYFRYAKAKGILTELDSWLRRKLRCVRLKQRKRAVSIAAFLQQLGVPKNRSWTTAACGKGWWRTAQTPAASEAMSNQWFQNQGLVSLTDRYLAFQH